MIENNIIQSLGAGSGIDSQSIVRQLTEIERSAPQQRIDARREQAEAQISDFGLLRGAMETLQSTVTALTDPEGLYSKSASFTESTALVPSELDTDVQAGVYSFEVNAVAQSQSLAFTSFTEPTDAVGEGTLTIEFGDWTRDVGGVPTSFAANAELASIDVVIDGNNNSLNGLRDAINAADAGLQASVINDGSGHRLVLSAASGANQQLNITVAEAGGSPTNTDGSDLSRFAFNTSVTDFDDLETQAGADAEISINGLSVTRSTNQINDIVDGLTVDVLKAAPGETITVTITDDKVFAEQTIRDFVDAYNTFLEEVEPAFGFNEETEAFGSLARDALGNSVSTQVRALIASSIPGLSDTNFTALTNVGIRTELDGTISINEDDFDRALDENFEDVQKVFAPYTSTSSTDITVNSFGGQTQSGNYDVVVSTPPAKGFFDGTALDAGVVFPNFDTTGKNYTFNLTVNGTASDFITLPVDTVYASETDLASAIQSAINSDSNLQEAGVDVLVGYDSDTNIFRITSDKYGSSSTVSIDAASGDTITDLGFAQGNGTPGVNVAGLVDGVVGFGLGNVLLPALGEDAEGLSLIVGENATSATANFSRGFGGELNTLLEQFLQTSGLFSERTSTLETRITELEGDEELLDRRMEIFEERLLQQFIAMESILNGLNSQGSFLDSLLQSLPFTSSNDG